MLLPPPPLRLSVVLSCHFCEGHGSSIHAPSHPGGMMAKHKHIQRSRRLHRVGCTPTSVCSGTVCVSALCLLFVLVTGCTPWSPFVCVCGVTLSRTAFAHSLPTDRKTSRTALLFLRSFLSTAFLALFLSRGSQRVCVIASGLFCEWVWCGRLRRVRPVYLCACVRVFLSFFNKGASSRKLFSLRPDEVMALRRALYCSVCPSCACVRACVRARARVCVCVRVIRVCVHARVCVT